MWRETIRPAGVVSVVVISIHSLRVEGDPQRTTEDDEAAISIHSLRVEGDGGDSGMIIKIGIFQSTPSVWRETNGIILLWLLQIFQSTPSVWRETRAVCRVFVGADISIHSLRVEGDPVLCSRDL